jgi:hypothetical protein
VVSIAYGLKVKGKSAFECKAFSLKELEQRIEAYYTIWKPMQSKGSDTSFEVFMAKYEKVKVTTEII